MPNCVRDTPFDSMSLAGVSRQYTTVHRRIRVKSTNHIYTKIFELLGLSRVLSQSAASCNSKTQAKSRDPLGACLDKQHKMIQVIYILDSIFDIVLTTEKSRMVWNLLVTGVVLTVILPYH